MPDEEQSPEEVIDGVIVMHRADEAYEMRKAGHSTSVIAEQLGYEDAGSVARAIRERMKRLAAEVPPVEKKDILTMELERLDDMQSGLWLGAVNGDPKAVDGVLKIMTMRAKYLGLDAPDASQSQNTVLVISGTEQDYVEKLKELTEGDNAEP